MELSIRAGLHGQGVFAEQAIPCGARIMDFTGPFLRHCQTTPQTLAVQVGPDLYLGASGGPDDHVNHSCEPNAGLVIGPDAVQLIAIRDIAASEEICFDYSTTMDEDDWQMICQCGAPGCRRIIRDGKHLPQEVWDRYLAMGIIPGYVQAARQRLVRAGVP